METIGKLQHWRRRLRLEIRLGTFVLTTYKAVKETGYSLRDFMVMLEEPQRESFITQEYVELCM